MGYIERKIGHQPQIFQQAIVPIKIRICKEKSFGWGWNFFKRKVYSFPEHWTDERYVLTLKYLNYRTFEKLSSNNQFGEIPFSKVESITRNQLDERERHILERIFPSFGDLQDMVKAKQNECDKDVLSSYRSSHIWAASYLEKNLGDQARDTYVKFLGQMYELERHFDGTPEDLIARKQLRLDSYYEWFTNFYKELSPKAWNDFNEWVNSNKNGQKTKEDEIKAMVACLNNNGLSSKVSSFKKWANSCEI